MQDEKDRVFPFSVKPKDKEAMKAVMELKARSAKTGIPFSHMVITAIRKYVDDTRRN